MRRWTTLVTVAMLAACAGQPAETTSTTPGSSPETTAPTTGAATPTVGSTAGPTTSASTSTVPTGPFEVLVFHGTAAFRHDSIPAGVEALSRLGDRIGFVVTATEDASVFTGSGLRAFEVVVFLNTTGDVLDGDQQAAMEEFVASGSGFVGIHSATDTEYDWDWYEGLVGAYFDRHPQPQQATVEVTDPGHPAMAGIPGRFERFDEWYDFRSLPPEGVDVLAVLDETTYEGGSMGDPHPITWAHEYDGGRSFYTGFGHTPESYSEDLFLTLLGNAILWASGR